MECNKCKKDIPEASKFCPECGRKNPFAPVAKKKRTRGNGEGTVFQDAVTKRWTAQISVWKADGKRHYITRKGFKNKKEAIAGLDELKNGNALKVRGQKVREIWDAMWPNWEASLSENKANHYKLAYSRLAPLHNAEITQLIAQDWQDVIDSFPGKHDPKKDGKIVASKLYDYAIAQRWIDSNIARFISLPGEQAKEKDAFTAEELARMWERWEATPSAWVGYILIMCYTGMRPGELRSVLLEDVHADELYMVGGIKSAAGKNRCIAFPEFLRPVVEQAVSQAPRKKLIAISEENFYKRYYEELDACQIARSEERRMTPHCCRHTFATIMANTGTALTTVQKMVGHSDVKVTARYTHAHDPELIKAAQKLEKPKISG